MRSFSARDGSGLDGRGYLSRDRCVLRMPTISGTMAAEPADTLGNNNTQPIEAAIFCA